MPRATTSLRLEAQDNKFRAEARRSPRKVRRYAPRDEMAEPRNARRDRPYIFGQERLV